MICKNCKEARHSQCLQLWSIHQHGASMRLAEKTACDCQHKTREVTNG